MTTLTPAAEARLNAWAAGLCGFTLTYNVSFVVRPRVHRHRDSGPMGR